MQHFRFEAPAPLNGGEAMPITVRGLAPLLQVFDMPASIAFYADLLGFEIVGRSGPGRDIGWVLLELEGTQLMLNTAYDEGERPPTPDPARVAAHADTVIYFGCPDVDGAYAQCPNAKEKPLPHPASTLPFNSEIRHQSLAAYEKQIFDFLDSAQYEKLGWCVDKRIRDTGPFLKGKSYGTHKSVLIYYSPGIMAWLTGQVKSVPDHAMMVKVQFDPPAERYDNRQPESTTKDW